MRLVSSLVIIAMVLFIFCRMAFALGDKGEPTDSLLYWEDADSNISPKQIVTWLKVAPSRMISNSIEHTADGILVHVILDMLAPKDNIYDIYNIRILLYVYDDKQKPITMMGYSIVRNNGLLDAYRYHKGNDKYMLFDYHDNVFEHDKIPHPPILKDRTIKGTEV